MFKKLLLCVAVFVTILPSQAFADRNLSNILYLQSDDSFEGGDSPEIARLSNRVHDAILNVARGGGFVVRKWTSNAVDDGTQAWISYDICLTEEPYTHVVGVAFVAQANVINNLGERGVRTNLSFIPCDTTITENELRDLFRKELRL